MFWRLCWCGVWYYVWRSAELEVSALMTEGVLYKTSKQQQPEQKKKRPEQQQQPILITNLAPPRSASAKKARGVGLHLIVDCRVQRHSSHIAAAAVYQ
jgi:hypothetical protein